MGGPWGLGPHGRIGWCFRGGFDLLKSYNLGQDRRELTQRENFLEVQMGRYRVEKWRPGTLEARAARVSFPNQAWEWGEGGEGEGWRWGGDPEEGRGGKQAMGSGEQNSRPLLVGWQTWASAWGGGEDAGPQRP